MKSIPFLRVSKLKSFIAHFLSDIFFSHLSVDEIVHAISCSWISSVYFSKSNFWSILNWCWCTWCTCVSILTFTCVYFASVNIPLCQLHHISVNLGAHRLDRGTRTQIANAFNVCSIFSLQYIFISIQLVLLVGTWLPILDSSLSLSFPSNFQIMCKSSCSCHGINSVWCLWIS